MTKHEAKFQAEFNNYLRELKKKKRPLYGNFELKRTLSLSIPFSSVKAHQDTGLLAAQKEGYIWKHSDEDSREKPFDCSSVPPITGYVVIRYPGIFFIITVEAFLNEKQNSTRKSLTESRAAQICFREVIM